MQWLQLEFDFTTGRYTRDYYDITTIDWFVDSDLGNDLNAGTAAAPFATITKVNTVAVNGDRVMINGIFTENVTISKQLRIIGVGGGRNGMAIFNNGGSGNYIDIIGSTAMNVYFENIELTNYTTTTSLINHGTSNNGSTYRFLNCFLNDCRIFINNVSTAPNIIAPFTVFNSVAFVRTVGSSAVNIYNNSTLYECTRITTGINIVGDNNHVNNAVGVTNTGSNNLINVDGQYFSPANNDFNFPSTSPLYQTGTIDGITGEPNNVGAGRLGEFRNADLFEFKVIGGAEFTNTEPSGTDIFRTNDTIDGYFESGIIDLNEIKRGVKIGIHNSYTESGGALTKLIQETSTLTVRQGLDCELIIGNTANEIITKKLANDWLLYEYGKPVTVTIIGGTAYGNADALFDPDDFIFPAFRFFKIKFRFKNA